jgi:hypothetical protein
MTLKIFRFIFFVIGSLVILSFAYEAINTFNLPKSNRDMVRVNGVIQWGTWCPAHKTGRRSSGRHYLTLTILDHNKKQEFLISCFQSLDQQIRSSVGEEAELLLYPTRNFLLKRYYKLGGLTVSGKVLIDPSDRLKHFNEVRWLWGSTLLVFIGFFLLLLMMIAGIKNPGFAEMTNEEFNAVKHDIKEIGYPSANCWPCMLVSVCVLGIQLVACFFIRRDSWQTFLLIGIMMLIPALVIYVCGIRYTKRNANKFILLPEGFMTYEKSESTFIRYADIRTIEYWGGKNRRLEVGHISGTNELVFETDTHLTCLREDHFAELLSMRTVNPMRHKWTSNKILCNQVLAVPLQVGS